MTKKTSLFIAVPVGIALTLGLSQFTLVGAEGGHADAGHGHAGHGHGGC